jgi:predicted  nucleic acid-binding Zn-ribbon protein
VVQGGGEHEICRLKERFLQDDNTIPYHDTNEGDSQLNEEIMQLTGLQEVDLEIAKFDAEIEAENKALTKREKAFLERQGSIGELQEKIEAAEGKRRELEAELADELSRIKERQSKMMQVQTNREYQSLLKEIEDGKKNIKEKEEEVVRIMEGSEADAKIKAEQESLVKQEEKELAEQSSEVKKLAGKIEGQKAKFVSKRDALAKEIKAPVLRKYDLLRTRRNGKAVVGVVNGVCQGCFMSIPPQQFNDIMKGDRILNCPTCQRILYHMPEKEGE